ncbi:MAG TPA: hypothetical protein VII19_08120, partial [Acidimicrobiales bacterium]
MMNSATPTSTARSSAGSGRPAVQPPAGAERLLAGVGPQGAAVGLAEHLDRWGSVPTWRGTTFLDELDASGLRGHGGAWFPVGTKWRSVRKAGLRSPVVVANGA